MSPERYAGRTMRANDVIGPPPVEHHSTCRTAHITHLSHLQTEAKTTTALELRRQDNSTPVSGPPHPAASTHSKRRTATVLRTKAARPRLDG
jgi:hypothetical protein